MRLKHLDVCKNEAPLRHTFVQVQQNFHHYRYLNHVSTAVLNELFSSTKYIDEGIWTIHWPMQKSFLIAFFPNSRGIANLLFIEIFIWEAANGWMHSVLYTEQVF